MHKVLVTGASGFIGRALCSRLLAEGWRVRGTVRSNNQFTRLPDGVETIKIDSVGLETDWSKALEGIDIVIHLAARVHVMKDSTADSPAEYRQVNVAGTEGLARGAVTKGVHRLVFMSSIKVNGEGTGGKSRGHPSEIEKKKAFHGVKRSEVRGRGGELKDVFSEKDVPEPQDPYAVSKWEAEQILNEIAADTGLEVAILRSPLVYGPGVRANFLKLMKIVQRGIPLPLGKVNNRRSLIYLENLADAIITCASHSKAKGQTYLVSDGEDLTTPDLIRRIASALGRPARIFAFPTFWLRLAARLLGKGAAVDRLLGTLTIDMSKIQRELEWTPPYKMNHGLRETAKWYKQTKGLLN